MNFKEFMDLFDNWNDITKVNDDNLNVIIRHKTLHIMENCKELFDLKVVSFGYYDGELSVRLETEGYDEDSIHYNSIEKEPSIDGIDFDYSEIISIIHSCKSSIIIDKLALDRYNLNPESKASIKNAIRTNEKIIDKVCEYTLSTFDKKG